MNNRFIKLNTEINLAVKVLKNLINLASKRLI